MVSLFEKYRPRSLDELAGQATAVKQIKAVMARGLGGRAFWITGPSGSGKSSLASIIARLQADDLAIGQLDAQALTPARLRDIEESMRFRHLGEKPGKCWIIEESHGLRRDTIRLLLVVLENLPPHVCMVFTTTKQGEQRLFDDDSGDAAPLLSRCIEVTLATDTKAFAERAKAVAMAEGIDGLPLTVYESAVAAGGGNLRRVLQRIESGAFKTDARAQMAEQLKALERDYEMIRATKGDGAARAPFGTGSHQGGAGGLHRQAGSAVKSARPRQAGCGGRLLPPLARCVLRRAGAGSRGRAIVTHLKSYPALYRLEEAQSVTIRSYRRVSTQRQDISMEAQFDSMSGFFRSNPQEPVVHYVDEGVSGSVPLAKRAGGGALLKAARPGDKILVAKLDRLFRSVADAAVTLADWAKGEIQLVALAENLDMGSPYGRALAHMASVFAELERELIRDRTKTALRAKKDRGEVCEAVPYGWDAVNGKLLENAREQSVIAEMKAWRARGETQRWIADKLNQLGVPPKRAGIKWHPSAVASVLGRSGA